MRLALSLLLAGSAISAQDSTRRPERLCFRAFDSARCRAYIITEAGYARALKSTTSRLTYNPGLTATKTDFDQTIHGAFGVARNYANRRSVGAAVVFDHVKHDVGFAGVELRYRDWIDTSIVALEFQLGYSRSSYETVHRSREIFEFRRFAGVRGGMAFHIGRYATVFTRAEVANSEGKRHAGLFVGAAGTSHASYGSVAVAVLGAYLLYFLNPPDT